MLIWLLAWRLQPNSMVMKEREGGRKRETKTGRARETKRQRVNERI
jgi:hypothetical protein